MKKKQFTFLSILFLLLSLPAFAQDPAVKYITQTDLDMLWVLLAAALIFMMQAGFKALEVGLVRKQHAATVAMKNVVDWAVASIVFFFVGFGLMFGKDVAGLLGTSMFMPMHFEDDSVSGNGLQYIFFLFQLTFIGTAVTIVSGGMSERMGFMPYLTASIVIALIIYPIFGHWVWSSAYFSGNQGWLEGIGFKDFAGSTVVHSLGAWVCLAGLYLVGPRIGRYDKQGKAQDFKPYSIPYATLGLFLLWFGWWGFNGGSTLSLNKNVGLIILNTNIAGAMGAFVAYFHARIFQKGNMIYEKVIGGALGGLVAITASADIQNPITSLMIGSVAGVVHNWSLELIIRKKIDDAVGAIPVHGFCGALGTLLVVIAPSMWTDETGNIDLGSAFSQLGVQLVGVFSCFVWAAGISFVMFYILKKTVGLRVSPQEEQNGYSLFHVESKQEEENLSDDDLAALLANME
jgi:Amt family ammonium transporter